MNKYHEQRARLNTLIEETPDEDTLALTLALHDVTYGILRAFAERAGMEDKVELFEQLSAALTYKVVNAALDAAAKKAAERN